MNGISTYVVVIILAVGVFGALLGVLRILHARRLRSATGAIKEFEHKEDKEPQKPGSSEKEVRLLEDEPRPARSLYGISYLAWVLTATVIPLAFLIVFFENVALPYGVPEVGERAVITYRSPVALATEERIYGRHDVLIPKGRTVTAEERQLVVTALENRRALSGEQAAGTLVLLAAFCFILLYHMNILYPTSTEKNRNLILIFLVILAVMVCAKLALFYELFSPYLIPVPWAGMIITIFINRRIVPLVMLVTLILVSILSGFDFGLFLVLLAGGLLSGSWVRQARKRSQVMLASFMVGAVMAVIAVCFTMLTTAETTLMTQVTASLVNGVVSGLLVLITLPFLEILFDLASPFRLMELLDMNTPVLKEFFFKAPGTYQHTMVVANLAEAVANEVGANGLLVRVGAYYHDIGKIFNPRHFIENQVGDQNPHDTLGPVASAAVVRSHVILGMKLARQIGLPKAVRDFILEHHGTSTIDYFYYKSKQLDSEIKSERIFKYPGPRPRSKETAILMIVDSVEAAFRVVEGRDEATIRELVSKIANDKMQRRELDQSTLTIGELKKIVDVLTLLLKSSFHQRVVYPTQDQIESSKKQDREAKKANVSVFSKR
jgi:cyclic-di-AMP phosphodiesterase PgpH